MSLLQIDADRLRRVLPWESLIEALRAGFRGECTVPLRQHHTVPMPQQADATLLLMPAWQAGRYLGVKTVAVFPDNSQRNLPAVHATYQLYDGSSGEPLALLEGSELTARRTAASSALAAGYLSRTDATRLLVVGTGRLSLNLIAAHCAVRPIREVMVWGRSPAKAAEVARQAAATGIAARAVDDLKGACANADIISTATLAVDPLVNGDWLRPGTHLDLVGGFRPDMREADDRCITRAQLFVDTRDGALSEAGDLNQPLRSGLITAESVQADLYQLCRGEHPGRSDADAITLFKSVGTALEDLAAAVLAYETVSGDA